MDLTNARRSTSADKDGRWVSDIPNMGDLKLRVRGLQSPIVIAHRSRKERKVLRSERERDGTLKPEVSLRLFSETLAEVVLLEWGNLSLNGEPIPYSQEKALELLCDPAYAPLQDAVVYAAGVVEREEEETKRELEKN